MSILMLLLGSFVSGAVFGQNGQSDPSRPQKAVERGVVYYPGGPRWSYNEDAITTTPAPKVEPKGSSFQTYDLRGLKQSDASHQDQKGEKYADYSRSSTEPVMYQNVMVPAQSQRTEKIIIPRALREYRITGSHHGQPNQRQQNRPSFFLLTQKPDNDWGMSDGDWDKKADSLWGKSEERDWGHGMHSDWKQLPEENWNHRQRGDEQQKPAIEWQPNSSERKTYRQNEDYKPNIEYNSRVSNQPKPSIVIVRNVPEFNREEKTMDNFGRQGYLVTNQESRSSGRLVSRYKDPCVRKPDGQYVLSGGFRELFPYVDNTCYFVKCANKKAFLNPCSPGTRNDEKGDGFCSVLDLEGYCGLTVYDTAKKNKLKQAIQAKPDNNYYEYLHGTYHRN